MRKIGLIALLMLLCMSGAAFAQTMPVFCGTLSQADCDILTNSQNAMASLDSASFDMTVNATVTNIPDMTEPTNISLTGNGSFSGLASLQSNMLLAQTDPTQYVVSLLQNFDADLTLTLTVPPALVEEIEPGMPNSITLQVRLVDGIGYLNLDTLQPFLDQPSLSGWVGLDLANLFQAALEQMPDLFDDMTMMGMDTNSMALAQDFSSPEFINRFATIERLDVGMPDEATFRVKVDFASLMSSPEFQDLMRQQLAAQGQTMTDEEIQQALAMSSQMLKGVTFTIDEVIGTTDFYVRSIHGTFSLDTTGMMAMMNEMGATNASPMKQAPPNVNVDFTIIYNNFNSVPPITAPENVMMLPWQALLGIPQATPTTPPVIVPPTAEATVEPTAEVTLEPTAEVTLEPTAEVTTEPPPESTVEPTAEVPPPAPEPTVEVTEGV